MDIALADSHVGEIERSVKTVKECLRSTVHWLFLKCIPKFRVLHIVGDAVRCLNQFPRANGISAGTCPLYNRRVELGQYILVFEPSNPTNTTKARSLEAIALTPTGNANGD